MSELEILTMCPPVGGPLHSRTELSPHILVVEDDHHLRKINAEALTRAGYVVEIAPDGAAAWEMLQATPYDLIITDNTMPKLSGIELLKKLRIARMEMPVIMASGTVPTQELVQNPGLNPVATLTKPYAVNQLLDTVNSVLSPASAKSAPTHGAPKPHDRGGFLVERYTAGRKQEWDAFVRTAKNATFLFERDYMDYHRERFCDHSLMVFKNETLVAVLPANLTTDGILISHEGLTYGGLVVSRDATLVDSLSCFHVILRDLSQRQITQLRYKCIPAFYNTLPDDEVAYALFLLEARLYRRDCSTTVAQRDRLPLRKGHHSTIVKARKLGVRVEAESSFKPFWERVLVPRLAARYGVKPVHTLEEITLLAARFPERIKQFSAYCGEEILAGTTIYETPTVAHVQYCAATEKGRRMGAQTYLASVLMKHYEAKRYFDFGISNEEEGRALNHGLQEWKEGFGGRCYAHDFYEIATGNFHKLEPVVVPAVASPVAIWLMVFGQLPAAWPFL